MFTCASFFAGVGGIDLGFDQTGSFKTVYANEFDPYPIKTFELNHDVKVDPRSIVDVSSIDIPDVDVVLAGFPCTDISVAGARRGLYEPDGTFTRSGLLFRLTSLLKEKDVPVIFLENVKNIFGHDGGRTFWIVMEELESLGYHVDCRLMNACEYGNVPQNRERVYFVGFKDKEKLDKFKFPESIPLTTKLSDVIDYEAKVDDKYYYTAGKYSNHIYERLVSAMDDPDTVYQWRRKYARKNRSGLIPTLTANQGGGGHNVSIVKTKHGIRKMTPRECFNAQGFPADFKLPADMSDSRLYKQAGNSVCVPVVRRIAEDIAKVL